LPGGSRGLGDVYKRQRENSFDRHAPNLITTWSIVNNLQKTIDMF
jgi:hypothetical protein